MLGCDQRWFWAFCIYFFHWYEFFKFSARISECQMSMYLWDVTEILWVFCTTSCTSYVFYTAQKRCTSFAHCVAMRQVEATTTSRWDFDNRYNWASHSEELVTPVTPLNLTLADNLTGSVCVICPGSQPGQTLWDSGEQTGSVVGVKEALFGKVELLSFTVSFFIFLDSSFFFTFWPLCPLSHHELTVKSTSLSSFLSPHLLFFTALFLPTSNDNLPMQWNSAAHKTTSHL